MPTTTREHCANCHGTGVVSHMMSDDRGWVQAPAICLVCSGKRYDTRPCPLDPSTPIEEVDAQLREYGLDPEKVAAEGLALVERLKREAG